MDEQKKAGGKHQAEKREHHLVSDETIMEKYGAQRDGESEDERAPDGGGKIAQEPGQKKRRGRLYLALAIVSVLAIAFILWLAIPNSCDSQYDNNLSGLLTNEVEAQEGFPVTISGTGVASGNFFSVAKELVYVSDTSLVRLEQDADTVYERSHSFYHPIARASGEYLMVYNVSSNGYRIDNRKDTVVNAESDNVIMAGDVAENGQYALVTEAAGYPSVLYAYKEDGTLLYKYSFANCYVMDVSLSADGSHAAVIGVTAVEGELVSQVYLLDFSDETPQAIATRSGTLLLAVEYCTDGRALAVGDNCAVSVAVGGELTAYEFGDMQLAAYDFNENRALVALSPYDAASRSKLAVLSSQAEEWAVLEHEGVATDASLYGDTMAVLTEGGVASYSVNAVRNFHGEDGEQQSAFHVVEAPTDAKAIALADESAVYILGISEVQFADY